jgi:mycothiol synthase
MMPRWARQLTADDAGAVRNLVSAATAADGICPLSEDAVLRISTEPLGAGHHLIVPIVTDPDPDPDPDPGSGGVGGGIAGYAQLAAGAEQAWQAELVVHPGQRRQGVGGRLLAALAGAAGQAGAVLDIWAHGDSPAAAALARRFAFGRDRVLWQLRQATSDLPPPPEAVLPADVTVRTFVPGQDEQAWVALNRRVFADHPEQGRWSVRDLALREAEPWFDPAGFFLAESAGRLVGFHWTKVHTGGGTGSAGTDAGTTDVGKDDLGEVYVIGVAPDFAGRGLGRALLVIGLRQLRDRGLPTAMLYVDGANRRAVRLYESLGFTSYRADVSYRHPR